MGLKCQVSAALISILKPMVSDWISVQLKCNVSAAPFSIPKPIVSVTDFSSTDSWSETWHFNYISVQLNLNPKLLIQVCISVGPKLGKYVSISVQLKCNPKLRIPNCTSGQPILGSLRCEWNEQLSSNCSCDRFTATCQDSRDTFHFGPKSSKSSAEGLQTCGNCIIRHLDVPEGQSDHGQKKCFKGRSGGPTDQHHIINCTRDSPLTWVDGGL